MNPQPKRKSIRLNKKKYMELRFKKFTEALGRCEKCGCRAPWRGADGEYNVFECGHLCHIKSKASGGDDTPENTWWGCYRCHIENEHGPRWSRKEE